MNKSGNHQATKMLNYECANSSAIMFNGDGGAGGGLEELISQAIQTKDNFAHHSLNDTTTVVTPPINPNDVAVFNNHHLMLNNPNFFDPGVDCVYPTSPNSSLLSLETDQAGFVLMPKLQPYDCNVTFNNSLNLIELNLDGRIYFYSGDDEFLNQLGLIRSTSTPLEAGLTNSPKCQVEGCNADLAHARHYHRRHKVCEFHSKASTVFTAGLTQRYCQQCSRFHVLSEFDEGKRSCRKRLADHNRRRRKASNNINEAPKLINDQPLEMVSDPPYL